MNSAIETMLARYNPKNNKEREDVSSFITDISNLNLWKKTILIYFR